jgi:hypothetical protein
MKSPDRAEAVMLAFAEISMSNYGIFEYYRQQAEEAGQHHEVTPDQIWNNNLWS